MGKLSREKPARLAEKLLDIRLRLNLSQNEMVLRLGLTDRLIRSDISKYERGDREPSLLTLLAYGRAYGTTIDVLADDELDLP